MADATVSKTVEGNSSCGFESHLRHQIQVYETRFMEQAVAMVVEKPCVSFE
jgi:hypothetical protein